MKQFSLSLLALCLAAPLAAQEQKAATPEELAVAEIKKSGGHVMSIAQGDARLEIAFHLADGEVTDKHLEPLAKLTNVYQLNLRGTKITDEGLKQIAGLKSLVRLHLEKTGITDAGLAHLAGLENLEYLNLYGTNVTDAGVDQLKNLKKLKRVYVWESKITDAGVASLKQALPEVQVIGGQTVAPPPPQPEAKPEEPKKP